jgi:hypothetical protein
MEFHGLAARNEAQDLSVLFERVPIGLDFRCPVLLACLGCHRGEDERAGRLGLFF